MNSITRWLTAVLVFALIASACSSDSSEESGTSTTRAPVERTTSSEPDRVEVNDRAFTAPEPDPTEFAISDDVRVGVLENGLTYYVMSNDSPGSSVSMRLVVGAGGYHEDPIGTGVAHFLEHMMFNGTERYPGNQVDDVLRSIGAEIGPDFNAYTSTTETVYQIAVEDRNANVDTAFDVLVQWASAATLDPAEVSAEAPIVREELRLREESAGGLVQAAFEAAYFSETPFEGVRVAGTESTINDTTPDVLRTFYDTWYRPDNMAVVAVGDRSLDDLEGLIVDRFAELEGRGQTLPASIPEWELRAEPIVDVVVEPTFPDSFISVDVPMPPWDLNTVGGAELNLIEELLGRMINNRIDEGVQAGRLDLRRGGGGWFPYTRGLQYIGFNADADDLENGTEVLMTEIESTIDSGFTQAELDRAADSVRSELEQFRLAAGTIQDDAFANIAVEHFLGGGNLLSIDDSVDFGLDVLDSLDRGVVNNHYGWVMTNSAPIVLIVGPDEQRVGDPANHLAALQRARDADSIEFEDDVVEISALMDPLEPVDEVEQNRLRKLDGFELVFENGMRVLFSESDIAENSVSVVTQSPGGRAELSDTDGAIADAALAAVDASGLAEYTSVQVSRYLSDVDAGLGSYVGDYAEGFSGGAVTEDLEVLFQLMHLAITAPRVEPVPFAQQIEFARDEVEFVTTDSSQSANVAIADARTGGGRFAAVPTLAALDSFTAEDALRIYDDRFTALDDHVVVVVGDVDRDTVIDLARRYVGTLPGVSVSEEDGQPIPPPGLVDIETSIGSGSANGAYRLLTTGTADETVQNRVLAELANSLLGDRLFTVIREELGATYGGSASVSFEEPGDGVQLLVSVDGDPARIDEIADAVENELATIAAGQIRAEDFAEATAVLESQYNFVGNGEFIETLFDEAYEEDQARIIDRRSQFEALNRITPESLSSFIDDVASENNRIDVRNVPAG